ncbi:MAG: DUF2793 domain-containing protein [Pseudomonadota bacterium]|jgi:hypothetical protein
MSEATARWLLPLIATNQAQKEVTHNEALLLLDALIHPAVESRLSATPPATPPEGAVWIVATGGTGEWTGKDGELALWASGGWRFLAPREGATAWLKDEALPARFDGAQWQAGVLIGSEIRVGGVKVLAARQPAIANPTGGTTIDNEARSATTAILAALRNHGIIAT